MCGVIGLVCERPRADLGRVAAELLKALEYRGYDSTGAAIQGEGESVVLRKGVGAPSAMVQRLGITELSGQLLCGQVRWATFGAVTEANCQPHLVRCKTFIYGAHNGNVTNCDQLKAWLQSEGHDVKSDNDGEMVVHAVEHGFAELLASEPAEARGDAEARRRCMRAAIARAAWRLEGSFAAVIVDPVSRTAWAIKLGSSLYFGIGRDEVGGRFGIASSDLSSVLKLTRVLVPIAEGEVAEFDAAGWSLWALSRDSARKASASISGAAPELRRLEREPVRSRLRAEDTALRPPFESFMEQEIAAQEEAVRGLVELFQGGSAATRGPRSLLDARPASEVEEIARAFDGLREVCDDHALAAAFRALVASPAFAKLLAAAPPDLRSAPPAPRASSPDAGLLADLTALADGPDARLAVAVLDALLEREEVREMAESVDRFTRACAHAVASKGRIFVTCCGSSYNAAKAGALFFNEIAHVELLPMLPGEFRGQCLHSLRDGDLFVAVSQSGETKDLIDAMNDVIATGKRIVRAAVVNNVNSTLAQEKADFVLPLRCGPEIAVPATKSFTNQLAVFYCLALKLAARRTDEPGLDPAEREALAGRLASRWASLPELPNLLRSAIEGTAAQVEEAAQLLHLRPSMHILATRISAVAREGALKVREVVLNHTEGFEGSEFKHGPNTILGFNTLFGPRQIEALLARLADSLGQIASRAEAAGLPPAAVGRLAEAAARSVFQGEGRPGLSPAERDLLSAALARSALLGSLTDDYPLVFVTGPDERDVALTVSQVNTHKIRGACTVVVAEESPALRAAASKPPADNPRYRWAYLPLPGTGDTLMAVFTSTVVLQRLALRMSLLKARYLDGLGFKDHGVHPDVPKNVSKSITVD